MELFCVLPIMQWVDNVSRANFMSFQQVRNQLIFLGCATLMCESALLVQGKSFVTSYTDFSFKQLKKNVVVDKGKSFRSLVSKAFSFKE